MNKSELRQTIITSLKALSKKEKEQIESHLIKNLTASDWWKESQTIGITVSHGFEWETRTIIEQGWKQGKTICVPKCIPKERKMDFYRLDNFGQLEAVYHNLMEPIPEETDIVDKNDIGLLVVPGIVFDGKGYRIGFGGGYYDRFLADFPNITVSLVSTLQLVEQVPVDEHDLPVQNLIIV
ncbi:5-formyltetrahydrofolate cyclo-ligase [Oceanobacillus senegalensis]|uniref:5-formyltetrahydrofolate cyclo-ligase n=1 Tax=Oceanobacillus senegalensis TaxID=1936063 RepID=UPI000A30AC4A|nr:5-formyltetrahydrofolate cyclo-ligase [Oceanobacillus senegalensis]